MTVGELIARLSQLEMDAEVGVSMSNLTGFVSKITGVKKFELNGRVAYTIDEDDDEAYVGADSSLGPIEFTLEEVIRATRDEYNRQTDARIERQLADLGIKRP